MRRLARHLESFFDATAQSMQWCLEEIKPAEVAPLYESPEGGFTDARHQQIADFSLYHDRDLVVRMSERHFLMINLTLPVAAKTYHREIIASRIDLISPWTKANAIFGTAITSETETIMALTVAIAARSSIDRLLMPIVLARPRSLVIETGDGAAARLVRIDTSQNGHALKTTAGLSRMVAKVFYASLLVSGLLMSASSVASYVMEKEAAAKSSEIRSLRETLAPRNDEAAVTADPLKRMVRAKATRWPVIEQLDQLSALLPDDTYLDHIDLSHPTLRLEGQSKNAADLPRLLQNSSRFVDAHFAAPTLKKENSDEDQFEIEMTLATRGVQQP